MLPLLLKKINVPLYIRYTISARCGETKFGTAQKEHKGKFPIDICMEKIQRYKDTGMWNIRKIQGRQVSPLLAFLPVEPCRGTGRFRFVGVRLAFVGIMYIGQFIRLH